MSHLIISSLYFILPAYLANMFPVFAQKLKLPLGDPINKKLFGEHKTWRGFYAGYIGALLVLFLQLMIQKSGYYLEYNLLDYENINIFVYAVLFGIGALTGDLIKSYFKRQQGIKSGKPWIPFDQLDFVVCAILFLIPVYVIPLKNLLVILIATPFLHLLTNYIGYKLKLKKVCW